MANKLKFTDQFIEITCERGDTKTLDLVRQLPYAHHNRTNTKFRTSIRNIDQVLLLFRGIYTDNPEKVSMLPPVIARLVEKEHHRRSVTAQLIDLGPTGETSNEHITLMTHQQLAKELAEVNDRYAFFYDTRTGKTPMSLQIIQEDIERNPHHKWLILCPLILIENAWLEDATSMFPKLRVVNLHANTKAKRLKQFKLDANLYITNIESFITYRDEIEKLNIHGCFVDESSVMKSNSSKFSKAAVDFAYNVDKWYLLSGTPAPNGEYEYYRQIQSVDFYGIHQSYAQFKQYFFNNVSFNPQYEKLEIRQDKKAELMKLIRGYSLYVDKEDVLTTPGRDFIEVEFNMPDELKEKYKELKSQLAMELADEVIITAVSTAGSLNKLNQVTSGFIMDTHAIKMNRVSTDKLVEVHMLSDYRFDELDKLLAKHPGEQILIWANYRKEFEILKERLGDKCALIYGATNLEQKNQAIKDFKSGKIQYLIANPASADKGLTLTNAHISIYFTLGYSYELFKQSMERIYGSIQKQPKRCIYYIMIAKGTVDKAIYNAVKTKGSMSTAILNHLKSGDS